MRVPRMLLASGLLLTLALPGLARAQTGYTLAHVTPVPGEGDFDFLGFDQQRQRLLVTRVGGIDVYDASTDTPVLVGSVPTSAGILANQAIAVDDRGFGFTSSGSGTTTIFDLSTLKVIAMPKLGVGTDAAVYDPSTGDGVFLSVGNDTAVVFDFVSRKVVGTIPLGFAPESGAAGGNGLIYVNLPDARKVATIDVRTRRIVSEAVIDPSCASNMGIAIDTADKLLFLGCANGVLDVTNLAGKTLATAPIGTVPDQVAFNPVTKAVFAGSVGGVLSVVTLNPATGGPLVTSVTSQPGARTIAIDTVTGRAFNITEDFEAKGPIPGTLRLLTYDPS